MEAGTGVYVLWGVGAVGVLLKIIISVYLSGVVKASQDMSTTRKKPLMAIRQKLENRRSLVADIGFGEAFVNKNVYSIKCMGIPIKNWNGLCKKLCLIVCMAASGAFLYYDVSWRGSPDMVYFMANAVFVCAFLLLLENIFLVTNKMELLKANIWDYLELVKSGKPDNVLRKSARERPAQGEMPHICRSADTEKEKAEKGDSGGEAMLDETAAYSEEILNSFLKEFFT